MSGLMLMLLATAASACGGAEVLDPIRVPVDIAVTVSGPSTIATGTVGTITITVQNRSSVAAESLLVRDSIDGGLAFVSAEPASGRYDAVSRTWDIGALGPNASVAMTIQARAEAPAGTALQFGAALTRSFAPDSSSANDRGVGTTMVAGLVASDVLSSTWSFATGNTAAALSDGGVWDRRVECNGGISSIMAVVPGSSVGFSLTPNVLRLTQRGSTLCGNIERTQNTLAPSQTHFGRFYFRNDETSNAHWHPVTYNAVGVIQIVPWSRFASASGVKIGVGTSRDGTGAGLGYPYSLWFPGTQAGRGPVQLENGRWYRYEWEIRYLSARSYRIYPRIYDMNGTLLYDYRNFYQNDNAGSTAKSLQTWYEVDNRSFGITDPVLAKNFGIGNEGPAGSSNSGGSWYIANVALSTTGWVGR